MKSIVLAAVALVAGVLASPVGQSQPIVALTQRQLEQPASVLSVLYQEVVAQTTFINETISKAPPSPSLLDGIDAAADINPRLAAITEAIQKATAQIKAQQATKRNLDPAGVRRQDDGGSDNDQNEGDACDAECLTEKVLEVVYEIVSTVRAVITKFGLGNFLSQINPLLLALSALVTSLNLLVTGLLITVTAVVTTLLGGLGLALLLLGWGA